MSASVTILLEGYTNAGATADIGKEITRPTVTLIRDGDLRVVVDPGIMEDQQLLVDALAKQGLVPEDIDIVAITHSHLSHYRNAGMFKDANILEYFGLWDGETVEDAPEQFSPHIQLVKTPGHDRTGISLFVDTPDGVIAVCGDVFWRDNYPREPREDKFASDPSELARSRSLVLQKADWIIPGHGPMFKSNQGMVAPILGPVATNGKKNGHGKTVLCRKCRRPIIGDNDNCTCRPWLCWRCCECGSDCNACGCSHKQMRKRWR